MGLGPQKKSELHLHWQHQQDHVRAELKNIYRRLQNEAEAEAFRIVRDRYLEDDVLVDLSADRVELLRITNQAVRALPRGQ